MILASGPLQSLSIFCPRLKLKANFAQGLDPDANKNTEDKRVNLSTLILIVITATLLVVSLIKDGKKTVKSLVSAKERFLSISLQLFTILSLIGIFLALVPESLIRSILGGQSVTLSTVYAALIGTVTIIPAFIAFPLAASLYRNGAHLISMAALITTLTMVGFATMPIEISYFGKRFTFLRNLLSFIAAIVIALIMGAIL